jgi:WD40 repeat protein
MVRSTLYDKPSCYQSIPVLKSRVELQGEKDRSAFCVRFSADGTLCAVGYDNGTVKVFCARTGILKSILEDTNEKEQLPIIAMRFRPQTKSSRALNILVVVTVHGKINHWHLKSGRLIHTLEDKDNQLFAIDYTSDGSKFAASGKKLHLKLYDEVTKQLVLNMECGRNVGSGHSNRMQSIKFLPGDDNVILTGGWDNTAQVWDQRSGRAERCIFGPRIYGDAVDMLEGSMLTGSYRHSWDILQLWDYGSGQVSRIQVQQLT